MLCRNSCAEGARRCALAAPVAAVSLLLVRQCPGIVRPDHVVVVIEEDRAVNAVGDPNMPYFNQLASTGLYYGNAHGVQHPSQPNYLVLMSGSTQDVQDNYPGYTYFSDADNLAKSLNSTGSFSFTGYAESLPSAGSQAQYGPDPSVDPDNHPDLYFRGYNPMAQFDSVGPGKTNADINKPFSAFPTNFAALPTVSFVIPDSFHNTHGSNEAPYTDASSDYDALRHNADSWLQSNLDSYLQWAKTNNSLLIVTTDEEASDAHPSNNITTIVNGDPGLFAPGVNLNRFDHYNALKTILDMYGLDPIGETAAVSDWDTNALGQLDAPPSNGTWIATAAGATWGDVDSWSIGLPNAAGATANFNAGATLQHTVTVDGLRTAGAITFNDASTYSLTGAGTIVIDTLSGGGSVNVIAGSHEIAAALTLNKDTAFITSSGAGLSISNLADSTVTIAKSGAGTMSVNRIRAAALAINAGTVSITGPRSESCTSRVSDLDIAGGSTPSATLDLGVNDLIVDYSGASPLPAIAAQIKSAYAGGSWNGNGITTSAAVAGPNPTGLGYADASVIGVGSFSDQSVGTSVLVRYTLLGDTNLDGTVNSADFIRVADHFGSDSALWSDGDVNYDGVVNALDFNLIAMNFGQVLPEGLPSSSVPEPWGLSILIATVFFRSRRVRGAAA